MNGWLKAAKIAFIIVKIVYTAIKDIETRKRLKVAVSNALKGNTEELNKCIKERL